jgi:K+-transporting ATPase KdpF subunit
VRSGDLIGLLISAFIVVYLFFALLNPEKL